MATSTYVQKIRRPDGRYVFVVKSRGNDVPIVFSANSYPSLDECERAIEGLDPEHHDEEE